MNWILLLALFTIGVALGALLFYYVYSPRVLTAEGENVDFTIAGLLVTMIVIITLALSSMYLLGKTYVLGGS